MSLTLGDDHPVRLSLSATQQRNLYRNSEWFQAYYEVEKTKFSLPPDVSNLVLYTPIGLTRSLCLNILFLAMSTSRILPSIGDYPVTMILLACSYFGLHAMRCRLIDFCFSGPGFHHVPTIIDAMIELYGFHHRVCNLSNSVWDAFGLVPDGQTSLVFIINLISIYVL